MPYNILILPLCGGYFILLNFVYLKYKYQRLSSQRLLFSSIITGTLLLFGTFILRCFLNPEFELSLFHLLNNSIPITHIPYLWTSIASFLIAFFGTLVFNLTIYLILGKSFKPAISFAVKKYGDEIEKLFRTSAKTGQLMQITLKNNKVYIGFTDIIPVPKETNYLKITPVMSGFRDLITKNLNIITKYFKVLEVYLDDNPEFSIYDIDISIKQDEILSASIYDQNVFNMFNENEE
ncbi:MAG: hypothetical protein LAT51_01030 [Flavobacteriaceae bacterium]|nr:hypothetical protein [Flavobacteriaceae bacterium]